MQCCSARQSFLQLIGSSSVVEEGEVHVGIARVNEADPQTAEDKRIRRLQRAYNNKEPGNSIQHLAQQFQSKLPSLQGCFKAGGLGSKVSSGLELAIDSFSTHFFEQKAWNNAGCFITGSTLASGDEFSTRFPDHQGLHRYVDKCSAKVAGCRNSLTLRTQDFHKGRAQIGVHSLTTTSKDQFRSLKEVACCKDQAPVRNALVRR